MDIVEQYNRDVIGAPRLGGNAIDLMRNPQPRFYNYVKNTPLYVPPKGAIAVWNQRLGNGYGHAAIVLTANVVMFTSIDQNYPPGSTVHEQWHNYTNVDGFLVVKDLQQQLIPTNDTPEMAAYKTKVRNTVQNVQNILETLK